MKQLTLLGIKTLRSCLILLISGISLSTAWEGNVCTQTEVYYENVRYCRTRVFWICWSHAWRLEARYRTVSMCCNGWTHNGNTNCNIPVCNPPCQNGGTCTSPGFCSCPSTHRGFRCDTAVAVCNPPCQNGGICIAPGRCSCPSKYYGSLCENAVCSPPCMNGGSCRAPGICSCLRDYGGPLCEFMT